jgi:hypothetical protein
MEDAIQSSVYVSSPDFAGWLTKRGFHVSSIIYCFSKPYYQIERLL